MSTINTSRITGLASGLDTDTLVKNLMAPYNTKVDKMKQDKQILQWKQDLTREIIGKVNDFKTSYFDILKQDKYILGNDSLNSTEASVSAVNSSLPNVSITTSSDANIGSIKTQVIQLASVANVIGNLGAAVTKSTKLSDLGITTNTSFDLTGSGITGSITIAVDGTGSETIDEFTSSIYSATGGKVKATFSELTGNIKFESTTSGTASALTLTETDVTDNPLNKLKLDGGTTAGKNSKILIKPEGNTDATLVEKDTNYFSIDGVNYKLLGVDDSSNVSTTTINTANSYSNINIKKNSDVVFNKIQDFVQKYNDMIAGIYIKVDEKKQRSYLPLTDDQRSSMKDTEITSWETKAKQGLLSNDSNLTNMVNDLRSTLFSTGVTGVNLSLSEIGINTSSDIAKRGKIEIDAVKLKSAIETKGEEVTQLFSKKATTTGLQSYSPNYDNTQKTNRRNEEGIFQRINDVLLDYTRTTKDANSKKGFLLEKAGLTGDGSEYNNTLTKYLIEKDASIKKLQSTLSSKETAYYNKFAKLEAAMNRLNSQSSWLSQQLGSSNG